MISIRASSLDDYPACPRRFAARWLLDADHDLAHQHKLRRTRPNIGAIVGTAVHSGIAYLLNELKATGGHGGPLRTKAAKQAASEEMLQLGTQPVTTDTTTPNVGAGLLAAHNIIDRYHQDVRHEHEPLLVEKGLKLEDSGAGLPYQVTGTLDTYIINGTLEDAKTGAHLPSPFAQVGQYLMLLKSNGYDAEYAKIRFGKRVRANATQPPIYTIDLDPAACEQQALSVARAAAGGLNRLLDTGDPATFIANPKDRLCSNKYCVAYGTTFCPFGGAITNGASS